MLSLGLMKGIDRVRLGQSTDQRPCDGRAIAVYTPCGAVYVGSPVPHDGIIVALDGDIQTSIPTATIIS